MTYEKYLAPTVRGLALKTGKPLYPQAVSRKLEVWHEHRSEIVSL
jgi:hypothetical protein